MSEFDFAVDNFITHLKIERGLAPKSIEAYARDLRCFVDYIDDASKLLASIAPDDISGFIGDINQKQLAPRTQARMLSALRGFFGYLVSEKEIRDNPMMEIESPKFSQRLPVVLTFEEIERLLASPDVASPRGFRDATMLHVMYAAGLRVSELVQMKLSDVDTEAGFLAITGKGSKRRVIPVGEWAIELLTNYMSTIRPLWANENEKCIFLTHRRAPMTRQAFWLIIRKYASAANIDKNRIG